MGGSREEKSGFGIFRTDMEGEKGMRLAGLSELQGGQEAVRKVLLCLCVDVCVCVLFFSCCCHSLPS